MTDDVFKEIRQFAEDKILCKCGNDNWKQFIYVQGSGLFRYVAGCKKCGTVYTLTDDYLWLEGKL